MNWFSRMVAWLTGRDAVSDIVGHRGWGSRTGSARVTDKSALRHSAVWACLRLRADMISSLPIDVYRRVGGRQVEVAKPGWLRSPFPSWDFGSWLWATQFDLDRNGNTIGIVTRTDAQGRVSQVEPVAIGDVSMRVKGRRVSEYRVNGEKIDERYIWHERQYRIPGSPVGLSPIEFAAWSIGGYLSAQQFALDWYENGAAPAGVLRNTVLQEIPPEVATAAKAKFKAATQDRDLFVTGKAWEWTPSQGDASSAAFLDQMQYGITDICRFLSVPGDMIDAPADGSRITYANVTQRNVQLLVVNLAAPIKRREDAITGGLPQPQFAKLTSDAILRMDPLTRAQVLKIEIDSRARLPSEWRALNNLEPLGEAGYAEFDRLFGSPRQSPQTAERAGTWPDFEPPVAIGWHAPRELESGRG